VLVLGDAAVRAVEDVDEILRAQALDRVGHLALAVLHDGVAVGNLVARMHQRVHRQRVVVRRRHLLLDERADDTHLRLGQKCVHVCKITLRFKTGRPQNFIDTP
jgi:hypothetical protein